MKAAGRRNEADTIAAIATAPGEAAVAVVRLTGPDSLRVADALFRCVPPRPSARPSHTVTHGRVRGPDGRDIDDALLVILRAPRTVTGEDVCEFQCHGGRVAARRVLRETLRQGCRAAEPGEFARRAFYHGKMDLVQAEGILDLVRARSDRAAAAALEQLEGTLSAQFNEIYDQLVSLAADTEATLDFPADELPPQAGADRRARLRQLSGRMEAVLATWEEGRVLREGLRVALLGRPNAGKSTLFNLLLGHDRAIVSELPGTTRDTIEEDFVLQGVPLRLIDTAGLRDVDCAVEREGVSRSRHQMARADLVLYLLDGSLPLSGDDAERLDQLAPGSTLVLITRADKDIKLDRTSKRFTYAFMVNLLDKSCLSEIRRRMVQMIEGCAPFAAEPHAVISERHRAVLSAAREELLAAETEEGESEAAGVDASFQVAARLRSAAGQLGSLTGRVYSAELLDGIFSRFCIGK